MKQIEMPLASLPGVATLANRQAGGSELPGLVRLLSSVLLILGFAAPAIAAHVATSPQRQQMLENPASLYGQQALFRVLRNGKEVGEHTLEFVRRGNGLTIAIESSLAVRYLGVPVYKFSYRSQERWQNGHLQHVDAYIRDNRKPEQRIQATRKDGLMLLDIKGKKLSSAAVDFASNHWHPDVLNGKRLFHTLHGRVYNIDVVKIGHEKINAGEHGVISAERYRYESGFSADVWYDAQGRWVKLMFKADDNSLIEYICQRCRAE